MVIDTYDPPAPIETQVVPEAPKFSGETRWFISGLSTLLLLAAWIYQPWNGLPLPATDYSEFLPLLRDADSLWERFTGLVEYFETHGRSTWLTYAFTAVNWTLFGSESLGWDSVRFSLMSANVALAMAFLRRLGASRSASLIGASLFVVSTPAAAAWTRLTGEPLSLLALLIGGYIALGFRDAKHWKPRAAWIAVLSAAAILAKEPTVAAIPVLVILAVGWQDGKLKTPRLSSRTIGLVTATITTVALLAIPILATATRTPADGYAELYSQPITATATVGQFLLFLLPTVQYFSLTLLTFLLLLGLGALVYYSTPVRRTGHSTLLALLLPIFGTAVYLPWPYDARFYPLPFFIGTVVLIAVSVTTLEHRSKVHMYLSWAMAGVLIVASAVGAHAHTQMSFARRQMEAEIVQALPVALRHGPLVVAQPGVPLQDWHSIGATLTRHAAALRLMDTVAPSRSISCTDMVDLEKSPERREVLVSYSYLCGSLSHPSMTWSYSYWAFDLSTFRIAPQTVQIDLLLPDTDRQGH